MSVVKHPLKPVYDAHSRVLILGTMPSPKSREEGFYYAHPQNRFWRILAALFQEPLPVSNTEKRAFVLAHHIALWDVLASCEIQGAADHSIRRPVANDLRPVLEAAPVRAIFTTGRKASELYRRLCLPQTGRASVYLPSPSAANCRDCTLEQLVCAYRVLLKYTDF
mgnify:FL=1